VLYAVKCQFNTVVVSARDTDVLLLLVSHFPLAQCAHLWMMSGISKKRCYIAIDLVFNRLPTDSATALLPFHVLTGCDILHSQSHEMISMEGLQRVSWSTQ
jgi:hypothetical protein